MHYKDRSSKVTIYTQSGPILAEHLECRCKKCNKGHFYGYTSDQSGEEDQGLNVSKKMLKYYDEDCLEAEVILILSQFNGTFILFF